MHKACPLSELAPGEALRLDTAPPIRRLPHGSRRDLRHRRHVHMPRRLTAPPATSRTAGLTAASRIQVQPPNWRLGCAPAKLPVRAHEVKIVDGNIMVIESGEAPNLPPGLTPEGHV